MFNQAGALHVRDGRRFSQGSSGKIEKLINSER
jgi:hypothetical protein